ncbi:MAG: hypothetical protein WBI40_12075 [Methylococcaceae bacterium]
MTTITFDDEFLNEVVAVSHYQNAQEAVMKILADYLQRSKKELPLFEQLRLANNDADDELAALFERDKDTGRMFEL